MAGKRQKRRLAAKQKRLETRMNAKVKVAQTGGPTFADTLAGVAKDVAPLAGDLLGVNLSGKDADDDKPAQTETTSTSTSTSATTTDEKGLVEQVTDAVKEHPVAAGVVGLGLAGVAAKALRII